MTFSPALIVVKKDVGFKCTRLLKANSLFVALLFLSVLERVI